MFAHFIEKNQQVYHLVQISKYISVLDVVKDGDVISLVSNLLNINQLESAKIINYTFGLGIDFEKPTSYLEINKYKQKRKIEESFKNWELQTFILISDYFHYLKKNKKLGDSENELYIQGLHEIDYIEYLVDLFIDGSTEDKIWFWKNGKRVIQKCQKILQTS